MKHYPPPQQQQVTNQGIYSVGEHVIDSEQQSKAHRKGYKYRIAWYSFKDLVKNDTVRTENKNQVGLRRNCLRRSSASSC